MLKRTLFTLALIFAGISLFAQDTIHMVNRDKIVAKVQEINPSQVKYKNFNFQDGPTYVVYKKDVSRIVYADGHMEYFREDNQSIMKVHPLLLGLNAFDLPFGFVTLNAEYYFPKPGISIKVPLSIGFRSMNGNTYQYYYTNEFTYYSKTKVASVGAELLYYPAHLNRDVNYFTGLSFEYGRTVYNVYGGHYGYSSRRNTDWFGSGVVNGILVTLSDRVNFGTSVTIGMNVLYRAIHNNGQIHFTDVEPVPLGRIDVTFGIRIGKIRNSG